MGSTSKLRLSIKPRSLKLCLATIDLTCNERGLIGRKQRDNAGDFVRRSHAPDGSFRGDLRYYCVGKTDAGSGGNRARCHRIHTDAAGRVFYCRTAGQTDDAVLRGRLGRPKRVRLDVGCRSHVDDCAPAVIDKMGDLFLHALEGTGEVH